MAPRVTPLPRPRAWLRATVAPTDREGGFTLVELAIACVLIGILAAVAIPVFLRNTQPAYDAQAKSDARNAAMFEESYIGDHETYVAGDASSALAADGFTKSADTAVVTVYTYATAAPGVQQQGRVANGTGSFCVDAASATGSHFVYDSVTGSMTQGGVCPV